MIVNMCKRLIAIFAVLSFFYGMNILAVSTANASELSPSYYCYGNATQNYAITYVAGCKARHYITGQYKPNPSTTITVHGAWARWGWQSNAPQGDIALVTQYWGTYANI